MPLSEELFSVNTSDRLELLKDAFSDARKTGFASIGGFLLASTLVGLRYEALRVPKLIQRRVGDWHNTNRSTFVPISLRQLLSPDVVYSPFGSQLWIPTAHRLTKILAHDVRVVGMSCRSTLLAQWTPTRIGFNYMHGSTSRPANIPMHTDVPEEKGVVLALDVSDSVDSGTMHIILSEDACNEAGIQQMSHDVKSINERVSMTVAELR